LEKNLVWLNEVIGEIDPEKLMPGKPISEAAVRNVHEFRAYIETLIQESRTNRKSRMGFIDRIVHTKVEDKLLTEQHFTGYLLPLIAAGNDTTRNATAGGLEALLQHTDRCIKFVKTPDLLDTTVEEILRWTSPVVNFLRTCTEVL
jgi:cholest-4-en-3-one 26-monooxygenase